MRARFLWHFAGKRVLLCTGDVARHAGRRMRALIIGIAALIFAAAVATVAGIGPALAQAGYDRPGADYANGPVVNGDPAVCAARCERDRNCRAWSFSYPSSSQPAMCWLKHQVVPPAPSGCCVSGVRGAGVVEPRLGELEYSIDRVGADYRSFEAPPDQRGKACAAACHADPRCRAWTYRRPGYGTPIGRCYLKDAIKPPRPRPCCISGVVR
jgi:PAN domain